jgi:hypothetical protein
MLPARENTRRAGRDLDGTCPFPICFDCPACSARTVSVFCSAVPVAVAPIADRALRSAVLAQLGTTTIDAVDLYSDDTYTGQARRKKNRKHKNTGKHDTATDKGDGVAEPGPNLEAGTKGEAEAEAEAAPRQLTRAEIIALNRLRQHEEPHDELELDVATEGTGKKPRGKGAPGGGKNQSHARFRRWGELLLAGIGEAAELAEVAEEAEEAATAGTTATAGETTSIENQSQGQDQDPPRKDAQEQGQEEEGGQRQGSVSAASSGGLRKELKTVAVQSHHFQNLFLFATRTCSCAAAVAGGLCHSSTAADAARAVDAAVLS